MSTNIDNIRSKRRLENRMTVQTEINRHDFSNLSAKLQRESIRYKEVLELADVLGYDIVWQKGREK